MLENNQNKELVLLEDLGMLFADTNSKQKRRYGLYRCYCGNEFKALVNNIKNEHTKSCGCHRIKQLGDLARKHSLSNHRLYSIWTGIIRRCTDTNDIKYKDYGGRGISVCDRWLSVDNFIDDMYPTFAEGLTIDRINVNSNYEKSNCRWADIHTQNRNTRKLYIHNTSGYRGVSFHKSSNKWISYITINNKKIHLGCYDTNIKAAKAYDNYVIQHNLEHTKNFS